MMNILEELDNLSGDSLSDALNILSKYDSSFTFQGEIVSKLKLKFRGFDKERNPIIELYHFKKTQSLKYHSDFSTSEMEVPVIVDTFNPNFGSPYPKSPYNYFEKEIKRMCDQVFESIVKELTPMLRNLRINAILNP